MQLNSVKDDVMRTLVISTAAVLVSASAALAQAPSPPLELLPGAGGQPQKQNANPCRDEVATALKKLRSASWFRMTTNMITETGPMAMEIDYVLPDKMHQKVTQTLTNQKSEIILVGDNAWSKNGEVWQDLPNELTQQLKSQMYQNVVEQQDDVGNYSCKGRVQVSGRDALSYKLEDEPNKESAVKNETYRMFYVDAVTGLPLSNALLAPGREKAPLFKAEYTYPIDMKIEKPANVAPAAETPPAAAPAASPSSAPPK